MERRKRSEKSGSSSTIGGKIDFYEKLAKEVELAKDLKPAKKEDYNQVADIPSGLVQGRSQEVESLSQRKEQSSSHSLFLERLNITPSQFEEIKFIHQIQEEKSSYKSGDYKDYQSSSDVTRAVGVIRPQVEKLLYEGKIEVLPDKAMKANVDIREVNGRVRISIKHDLSFGEKVISMVNAIDNNDKFRDLFQGEIKLLQQQTSDIDMLYRDAEPARQELYHFIRLFAAQTDACNTLLPSSLKNKERLYNKAQSELGGDISRVTDIARGSIVYQTVDHIKTAATQMKSALSAISPDAKVVRVIDRFIHPTATGYRDMWCDIQMSNGHIAELHLRLAATEEVAGEQHKIYEETRDIRVKAVHERREKLNNQEHQKLLLLNKQSRGLFERALNSSENDMKNDDRD